MATAELLRFAAEALEDGIDPFSHAWLSEHEVTFEQCMALSDALATGARLYAWALENPAAARAAVNGAAVVQAYEAINKALPDWIAAQQAQC